MEIEPHDDFGGQRFRGRAFVAGEGAHEPVLGDCAQPLALIGDVRERVREFVEDGIAHLFGE